MKDIYKIAGVTLLLHLSLSVIGVIFFWASNPVKLVACLLFIIFTLVYIFASITFSIQQFRNISEEKTILVGENKFSLTRVARTIFAVIVPVTVIGLGIAYIYSLVSAITFSLSML